MFDLRGLKLTTVVALGLALVAFDATTGDAAAAEPAASSAQSIGRSLEKLRKEKKLKIAYFGGAPSSGRSGADSWRSRTTAWFQSREPAAKVTEIDAAGMGGSQHGAFRLRKDIVEKDPDLVFVEFAVDDADVDEQRVLRSVEGIVRQFWTSNPWAELVFVYTTNKRLAAGYEGNEVPRTVGYQRAVAKHYGIPEIDVGRALVDAIRAGKASWESLTVDGTQPNDAGTAIYAQAIETFLAAHSGDAAAEALVSLPDPLTKDPFSGAHLQKATATYAPGWTKVATPPDASPSYIEADTVGTDLVHSFTGSTVGLLLLVGPDGGDVEWTVDDRPPQRLTTFDAQPGTGPRLKFVILADDLGGGEHTLTIRIHPEKQPGSTGMRVRLVSIMMHCDC